MKKFILSIEKNFVKLSVSWVFVSFLVYTTVYLIYPTANTAKSIILLSAVGIPFIVGAVIIMWGVIRFISNVINYIRKNGYDKRVSRRVTFAFNILMIFNVAYILGVTSLSFLNIVALIVAGIALIFGAFNMIDDIRKIGLNNYINETVEFHT